MEKKLETFLALLSMASLVLAAIATFAPIQANAQSNNKQYVSTECIGSGGGSYGCNNCDSGSNSCTDHTCAQCKPPQQ